MNEKTRHKFVVLLNKKIETGVAMNAAAHMAACLAAKASPEDKSNMMFIDYVDGNGNKHPSSALSLIVLKADNANKIRVARQAAQAQNILFVDFLQSMTGDTYVEQLSRTSNIKEDELEYYGLCLFGEKEKIDSITGKFSIWRN